MRLTNLMLQSVLTMILCARPLIFVHYFFFFFAWLDVSQHDGSGGDIGVGGRGQAGHLPSPHVSSTGGRALPLCAVVS